MCDLICSTQYAADQTRYTSRVSRASHPFDATHVSDHDFQGVTDTLGTASRRILTCPPPRIRYPGSCVYRESSCHEFETRCFTSVWLQETVGSAHTTARGGLNPLWG